MDSFEWNRIAGWVLTAAIAVLGLSIVSGYWFTPAPLEKPAYIVEGVEVEAEAGGAAADAEPPIAALLATASAERGAAQFKKCAACHTIERGGANGIGPNLYGIMGDRHAHIDSFDYSDAMEATADQQWDWESMSKWLKNPRAYIPGNKMAFAGLSKPQDRADLLLYLNSMDDSPLPIPAAPAAQAAAPAAEGAAAPAAAEAAPAA